MNTKVQTNPKILEKRPIASVLKAMEVDNVEIFPISQFDTVRHAITRRQMLNRSLKYRTTTDLTTIKVIRTA